MANVIVDRAEFFQGLMSQFSDDPSKFEWLREAAATEADKVASAVDSLRDLGWMLRDDAVEAVGTADDAAAAIEAGDWDEADDALSSAEESLRNCEGYIEEMVAAIEILRGHVDAHLQADDDES